MTINGDLTVNTPHATVNNNATVGGTTTIIDVSSETWNELVSGNNLVFNAAGKTLNIGAHVSVNNLTVDASGANVTVADTAKVTAFTANSAVTVTGAGNIESAEITAENVVLDAEPKSVIAKVDIKIGKETKTAEQIAKDAFYKTAKESYEIKVNETLVANVGFDKSTNALTVTFKDNNTDNVLSAAGQFFTEILQGELGVKEVTLPAVEGNNQYPEKPYTLDEDQIGPMAVHALALISGNITDFGGNFDFTAKIQLEGYVEYEDNFSVEFVLDKAGSEENPPSGGGGGM